MRRAEVQDKKGGEEEEEEEMARQQLHMPCRIRPMTAKKQKRTKRRRLNRH